MDFLQSYYREGNDWVMTSRGAKMLESGLCDLSHTRKVLEETEAGIRSVSITRRGEIEVASEGECRSELAVELGEALPCVFMWQTEAERLD